MRRIITLGATLALPVAALVAQPVFTNGSALLSHAASSGGCMAVCDMNGDGLDDITQLDGSENVYVLYQNTDGTFSSFAYGAISGSHQWGWAIGDIDNNGHKDVIGGGSYDGTHYLRITSEGVANLQDLNGPDIFTQCMSLGDLDNDGKVDVFACHDDGPPNIWFTNGSGVPMNNNAYINWTTSPSSDMSGNYGSTFTDFDNDGDLDLYISHCRQGVNDPNDPRRWNRLFVNDGTNHYTDEADVYGLENHYQTWTSDFGDYDNDGDMDVVSTNHDNTMMLFENDGTGHFTEVTAGSGLEVTGFFLQGLFRDFDNDGFLDVLTASAHHYFKGHGDGTFTEYSNIFPATKEMHSFAIGDLNNDGFEDVYASYGDGYVDSDPSFPDRLWLGTPNGNHWFRVHLKGVASNRDAIGARVTITGAFGTMIREVHAGESYGIVNSMVTHFGLGSHTMIDQVEIHWPSGQVDTYTNLPADQNITVIEGTCISPVASITPSGAPVVCTGGTPLTLTANAGFNYLWNTTEVSQSIIVTTGGTYTVTIDDGNGCTGQASIYVEQDPDETPTVSLSGDATFCDGGSVTLTSSSAAGYTWSNTETTQSITVSQGGTYDVTINGVCGDFTSTPVVVTVLAVPATPTAADVFLPAPGTADLTATGDSIVWFDVPSGGTAVGTGSPWTTPFLNSTTTFWCEDVAQYGGAGAYGGQVNNTATGQYHSSNTYYLLFDAYQDMVIRSVKVYANGAANRNIEVLDYNAGTTVASGTFNIPNGESRVDLNFTVPTGGPYGLRVTSNNPQLWRDGTGSNPAYPFALGTLGSITSSSVTGGNATEYYYFFYDWEVEELSWYCSSGREDVVVDVSVGIEDPASMNGLQIWPNPADATVNINFTGNVLRAELLDITGRVVLSRVADARALAAGQMSLDVSAITTGEYMLRIDLGDRTSVQRVVIQ